jgi:hypothetical protein
MDKIYIKQIIPNQDKQEGDNKTQLGSTNQS